MNKQILYLECATGISGDMTVAALLDLGASKIKLLAALESLNVEGYSVSIGRANSHGVDACSFDVELEHEHHHEHEHEHEHHHEAALEHEHHHEVHEHEHGHHHEHGHEHHHEHHHPHEHRNLADVTAILNSGSLSPRARELALKIFGIVAEAESKAHGKPVEEVHFHEVGAIDSIVDIAAAAVCLDDLGIDDVIVSGLSEGTGFVECQHGLLPIPVPAVANIAAAHGLPLRILPGVNGEMVTPTGAAIAAAVRTRSALPESFTIAKIGLGAGKRDFGMPNVLRAMLIEETKQTDAPPSEITILETNIDDSTGETLGLAMESLLDAGALDVHYIPVFMKKNRPAWLLRVICRNADIAKLERVIFTQTSSIGIRKLPAGRTCLARTVVDVALPAGTVKVKKCTFDGQTFYYPEYESVKVLAAASGVPFADLFRDAAETARKHDEK